MKILINFIIGVFLTFLVLGFSFLFVFTEGFSKPINSFYLMINDKLIYYADTGLSFSSDNELQVDVKFLSFESKDYTVKVIPNKVSGKNFAVKEGVKYFSISDLTKGFDIIKNDTGFTIKVKSGPSDCFLSNILHNVLDVPADDSFVKNVYYDMFILVVNSGESIITVDFSLSDKVTGVVVSDERIEF